MTFASQPFVRAATAASTEADPSGRSNKSRCSALVLNMGTSCKLMSYSTLMHLLVGICVARGDESPQWPSCVYHHSSATRVSILPGDEEPIVTLSSETDDQGQRVNVTVCRKSTDFCYTFWKDPAENQTAPTIMSQGCWESSNQDECNHNECLSSSKSARASHQSRFCCCSGHLCNLRVAVDSIFISEYSDTTVQTHDSLSQAVPSVASRDTSVEMVVIVISVLIVIMAVTASVVLIFQTCIKVRQSKTSADSKSNSVESQNQPLISGPWLDSLKLVEIIGQGRYGTVWKASLGNSHVAVKVFSAPSRCYYYNEREVYSLPLVKHPNVVEYLGSDEVISVGGHTEYRLILEYAPFGCLQDYLRHNSIDWSTLCKMGSSVTRGLAHLHTDYHNGDQVKMCIAHRDINSRNILVKADLTCCLCDLGFAMPMLGAHYYTNGQEQHAETTSLCDVGTLRYMSPEVLEGAVNLRECESSLKQIDVYSLGLVLWEIAYRCYELYPSKEAPAYLLPFEEETGPHPTLEQMKMLVCRHKARPLLPETWPENSASVRLLRATLEDAWDQDAEARLTSLCVEERWAELAVLWEREKSKGFSPTLHTNPCNLLVDPLDPSVQNKDLWPSHFGQPSDAAHGNVMKNNSSSAWPPSPRPLQPHQGRNPCLERNTCAPSQELSVSGNALVDRSAKHLRADSLTPIAFESAPRDATGQSSSSAYVNYSRVVNPIPYVQNAVRDAHRSPADAISTADAEPNNGIGKFLLALFRLKSQKSGPTSMDDAEEWEEHQRLCPTLSSPLDVESAPQAAAVSEAAPPVVMISKTNNQAKATQVRWEEQGLPSVSLIKSPNISLPQQSMQTAMCNTLLHESVTSGGAKLQAVSNNQPTYSPQGLRRQETKSAAVGGCDKTPGGVAVMSSEFSKPRLLPMSNNAPPANTE